MRGISVAADGHYAISASDDSSVRIWQLPTAAMGEMFAAGDAPPQEQVRLQSSRIPYAPRIPCCCSPSVDTTASHFSVRKHSLAPAAGGRGHVPR